MPSNRDITPTSRHSVGFRQTTYKCAKKKKKKKPILGLHEQNCINFHSCSLAHQEDGKEGRTQEIGKSETGLLAELAGKELEG